jgi:hypothetical protein
MTPSVPDQSSMAPDGQVADLHDHMVMDDPQSSAGFIGGATVLEVKGTAFHPKLSVAVSPCLCVAQRPRPSK